MATKWQILMVLVMCSLVIGAARMQPSAQGGGMLCGIRFGAADEKMIAALRDRGPEGLDEALRAYDWLQKNLEAQQKELTPPLSAADAEEKESIAAVERKIAQTQLEMQRMSAAIDQIGGQRNCAVSRLYWYTDLEQAKVAAAQSGRPILSLRMLGKLTDEYSCANSRFFRTALYSNKDVSDFLRTNFVLHWESVRPVPRVTIDFGDGRKLERTLTGNSAHYVLASDGTPLDVLPGLYSPQQFGDWLERVRQFHDQYVATDEANRASSLAAYHAGRRAAIMLQWDTDIERLGPEKSAAVMTRLTNFVRASASTARGDANKAPKAALADAQSAPKRATAVRIMRFANLGGERLELAMDDDAWQAIADLYRADVKLDDVSVALMRREAPPAADAARRAVSKSQGEDPILRVVKLFEDSMALDTVRNEYLLHRRIHEEFVARNAATTNADALNEWVYAELFLTPSSDPWLGLAPRDVYSALEGDGRTVPAEAIAGSSGG